MAIMSPSIYPSTVTLIPKSMATETPPSTVVSRRRTSTANNMSALEARVSLIFALASQTTSVSQRRRCLQIPPILISLYTFLPIEFANFTSNSKLIGYYFLVVLADLATETAKYVFPKRFESRNLEEALMSVPDLETVKFKVLKRNDQYEIRELEPYFVAETTMPGRYGFDLNGASQSFNVLAEYLFGKNTANEAMEMTTPVITRRTQSEGETMAMTTPVITKKMEDEDKWKMSFVMPSKYGSKLPLPKNSAVTIKEVPGKTVAVVAFSGFVSDEDVMQRESRLRNSLMNDSQYKVKSGASVEVAQYNPPFTLPFTRRNEISLQVERKQE